MSDAKCRPYSLGLNVLKYFFIAPYSALYAFPVLVHFSLTSVTWKCYIVDD